MTDIKLITYDEEKPEFKAILKDIEEVMKKHPTTNELRILTTKPKGKYTIISFMDLLKIITLSIIMSILFTVLLFWSRGG